MTKTTTKRDKRDNVFLPGDFEERRNRAIERALAVYWKDMQMGPHATIVRLAFGAGFVAGQEFEEAEKWKKMMAGIGRDG